MRLRDRVALVGGAGHSPAEGIADCPASALLRENNSGATVNIHSMAALPTSPYVPYMATKTALIAFPHQPAFHNAQYRIRADVIRHGVITTPMAVDTRAREFKKSRAEV